MKTTITGRKVNLRDSFKSRIDKKLSKYDRFFGDDAEANVTVSLEKNRYTVELTIRSATFIYRVEHTSLDLDECLDIVVEKLSGQIRKNKTRLEKKMRRGAQESLDTMFAEIDDINEADEEEEESEYRVVRTKKFPVKPMDVEEAILQMNLLGHQFFMFSNIETGEINVVYLRKDGDYGLLEPDVY